MASSEKEIPFLLKVWGGLYNAVPNLYIPGTKFEIGFTIVSCIVISCIRLSMDLVYTKLFNFGPENPRTADMSSCTASAIHSLLLVPALWSVLRDQPYKPTAPIAGSPKYYQDAVTALLQLCTGYMFYDFIFLLKAGGGKIEPDMIPFAAHHIVTVIYMSQTRVIGAGHISAMTLMWSGEFTNPIQNSHNVSRFAIQMAHESAMWHTLHPIIEFTYAFFYFIFRAFVGPMQIIHISYELLTKEGRKNIPLKIGIVWIILIWGIILGSIPWVLESLDMVKDGLVVKYHKDYDYGPRYEL